MHSESSLSWQNIESLNSHKLIEINHILLKSYHYKKNCKNTSAGTRKHAEALAHRLLYTWSALWERFERGTQREYSWKPLKHSIVKRILVFKR